jgi:shikimate kinase
MKNKPVERVILIGYRGAGKTTVARLAAERLGWSSQDADAYLENKFSTSVWTIFQEEGEVGFRDKEAAVLTELLAPARQVVATGGGVVLRSDNRANLRAAGFVVWLTASAETLWRRLEADAATLRQRPPLTPQGGLTEIRELLAIREPYYRECADLIVDTTDLAANEVVDKIVAIVQTS